MKRVTFLIDGFNLYHSIRDLYKFEKIKAKWLDINSLCSSYVQLFGKGALMHEIYYFSAIATHLSQNQPDTIQRHKEYMHCLENTGIKIILGRFKEKRIFCSNCRSTLIRHEEKETDVSIAIRLFELFHNDLCDIAVIVSGDTDLAPAVRSCYLNFPKKDICFCFPYRRKMKELAKISTLQSFSISSKSYLKNQFSNPYKLINGTQMIKPITW